MILTRTPLRVTLGGGGTDAPEYVRKHGGRCVTAAIDKYVYIMVNQMFDEGYLLKYSQVEHVKDLDEIDHSILREALRFYDIPPHTEVASFADVPSGTGLGSSGAFTVALCHALSVYAGKELTQTEVAADAALVELVAAQRGGGMQDHYACALGDIRVLDFQPDGGVDTRPLYLDYNQCQQLESRLRLFSTGFSRCADDILNTQTTEGLDEIKAQGGLAILALECFSDFDDFGRLLNTHWQTKRQRSPLMSTPFIDKCYSAALEGGAIGGKLVGAGGGGFLMFYTHEPERLASAMATVGLKEMPFRFDHRGTTLISCSV